jgi:hypothetical protein
VPDDESDDEVADLVEPLDERLDEVLALAVDVVVALGPSRHASTPPSESSAATLSAVAVLRAPAARGRRRRRAGVAVGSAMTVNVRTLGERPARAP